MKRERKFWVTVALVFVAILVWHVTSAMVPALAKGIKALTPFLFAFITAYLLRHPCIWMEKFFKLLSKKKTYKWQHTLASIIVLVLFLGLLFVFVAYLVPTLINNMSEIISNLPTFIGMIIDFLRKTVADLSERLDEATGAKLMEMISLKCFTQYVSVFLLIPKKILNCNMIIFRLVFIEFWKIIRIGSQKLHINLMRNWKKCWMKI